MIRATVYKNADKQYIGMKISGHAGFDHSGRDIICAAVSALVMNTINSIETFTSDQVELRVKEAIGEIAFRFKSQASDSAVLLMNSLVLGLENIKKDNNEKEYIRLIFREV